MDVLRTPDERFTGLPEFDFDPHYVDVPAGDGSTLRVHHLDEGDGPVVLLMHGEPTWSYLYRHVIPPLVDAGFRCIAPDLVGFGRSDKPSSMDDHTYARHVGWMEAALFDRLDLEGITMFAQDWGGLIGLRLVAAAPRRFSRLVLSNTGLPTGDVPMPDAFLAWQKMSTTVPFLDAGRVVDGGTVRSLDEAEIDAYRAPFPDAGYQAAPRVMPALVPTSPDDPASADNRAAWKVLSAFERPVLCAWSDSDPITAGGDRAFRKFVPGAHGQPHTTIEGGGHFVQEDRPDEIVRLITST